MVSKRCSHEGCTKLPSWGLAGSRKHEFCAQHAMEGLVEVVRKWKTCSYEGCTKLPSWG